MGLVSLGKTRGRDCFPSPLSSMWRHRGKMAVCPPGSRSSKDTKSALLLILDFVAPELGETNACCLSHPIYDILLHHPSRLKSCSSYKNDNSLVKRSFSLKKEEDLGAQRLLFPNLVELWLSSGKGEKFIQFQRYFHLLSIPLGLGAPDSIPRMGGKKREEGFC